MQYIFKREFETLKLKFVDCGCYHERAAQVCLTFVGESSTEIKVGIDIECSSTLHKRYIKSIKFWFWSQKVDVCILDDKANEFFDGFIDSRFLVDILIRKNFKKMIKIFNRNLDLGKTEF